MSYSKEIQDYLSTATGKYKKNNQLNDDSLILYIEEINNAEYVEQVEKAYEEMSSINLKYCEMGCCFELEEAIEYEAWLSESDMSDDDDDSEKRRYILC
ncbi:hypothetical protein [Clostridium polynesiense]|uniref:hypothetical protein n=1 Tax=Clostridium polynesiense TaxID=1325933 RepID=UPI0006943B49|nr:hypothetical protein [Clostridium polynesiense]